MAGSKFKGMRNRQAARYATWSAGIAFAICLAVIGVYVQRRMSDGTNEKGVHTVPSAVAQQSAGFTISRTVGPRTIFTVHASQATEFKDQNRSLLENVDITIYGPRGDRNDSVRAGECSYEPKTGSIRCQGLVRIDLRNSKPKSKAAESALHLETSDILFARESGRVSTENPVTLKFPGGGGTGTGLVYEPQTENATLERNVRLDVQPPSKASAAPVHISGSALQFRRSDNVVEIAGPVRVQQDGRTLTAGALELQLDSAMHPSRAVATRNPQLLANERQGSFSLSAGQITADLSSAGFLQGLSVDGKVRADIKARGGEDQISAQHAQVVMNSGKQQTAAREVLAQGNVTVLMNRSQSRESLTTENLRVRLSSNENGRDYRIVSAESLAPAKITMRNAAETDELQGGSLSAVFGEQNEIAELRGASGVQLERTRGADPPEIGTAANLIAKFDADGNWRTIDEKGNVTLQQGPRHAAANSATLVRTSGQITLSGAASVDDPSSHLQADAIQIDQATSALQASGNVAASFAERDDDKQPSRPAGVLHISADQMDGSLPAKTASAGSRGSGGHYIFSGHARLWQASDVLQARTIEFWQSEKRAEARGDVLAEFVEAPHGEHRIGRASAKPSASVSSVLWRVRAQQADYWGSTEKMDWAGGVDARSSEGAIQSPHIEMLFSRTQNNSRQLERAVATGGVRIEQNGRTGTADRGEYIAREGKFILSGGRPTLADSSGNSTTGRELTFFLASDTILIDSHTELRTVIKHRAEK